MRGIYWSTAMGSALQRKRFTTAKKNSENKSSLEFVAAKLSFVAAKRFATAKTPLVVAKEGSIK